MSRVPLAVLLVLVALPGVARADDDEQVLETPPPQGIPERMQELEREWADDVGAKDPDVEPPPEPSPVDEAHDAARGTDEPADVEPAPPAHADDPAPPKKSSPVLESPIRSTPPARAPVRGMPPSAPKEDAPEAPAKASRRPARTAEE